jgi:membrane-bound metal-dependent hydrolase YbcI (DUF457 family)
MRLVHLIPVITHSLAAGLPLAWSAVSQGLPSLWLLPLAIVAGNLPDIDTSYSHIGRLVLPLSRRIERRWGHRTITHSLLALGAVTLATWLVSGYIPWLWPWLPLFYTSHLILDMLVGQMGVPLFWPWKVRFTLFGGRIRGGSVGEQWLAAVLAATIVLIIYAGDWDPAYQLHQMTGAVRFALVDYREWQGMYRVYAEVDGTWNATGQRVDGALYEIVAVEGETLQLSDGQRTFSAGTSNQEMYLRRVVAMQGERIGPVVAETPVSIPTPVVVTIRVPHVFDPETEILVKPGDVVEKGQKLAELRTWRSRQARGQVDEADVVPAPVPRPTVSATPEPTGETVTAPGLERAWAELELARSLATRAAAAPSVEEIDRVCMKAETMRRQLWRDQIARDMAKAQAIAWEAIHVMEIDLDVLEGDIATADAECAAIRERQHAANPDDLAVAAAQLRLAEVEYRAALVALTPTATRTPTPSRTPTPTRTPTATKTPRPTPEAEILALVAGTVAEVRVASVIGNEATVEIVIQVAEIP